MSGSLHGLLLYMLRVIYLEKETINIPISRCRLLAFLLSDFSPRRMTCFFMFLLTSSFSFDFPKVDFNSFFFFGWEGQSSLAIEWFIFLFSHLFFSVQGFVGTRSVSSTIIKVNKKGSLPLISSQFKWRKVDIETGHVNITWLIATKNTCLGWHVDT